MGLQVSIPDIRGGELTVSDLIRDAGMRIMSFLLRQLRKLCKTKTKPPYNFQLFLIKC